MPFQPLYKNIFNKNDSDAGAAVLLQQAIESHPYFSLAHFFLLTKADTKGAGYAKIAAKTALHFNNTFLLQSQLHKNLPSAKSALVAAFTVTNAQAVPELTEGELPLVASDNQQGAVENEEVEVAANADEHLPDEDVEPPESEKLSAQTGEDLPGTTGVVAGETQVTKPNTAGPVTVKKPTLGAAIPSVEGSLLFTPLYATDYFASQGIKLREEALPNDKLGKQLKSFTDWLKTMKKVHDSKLPAGSEVLDLSVQKLAEKSNKEEQVITESMAEVFLQQGKLHKAKEIYEKLSLLDPSKIAYFAAKIDQIQQK